MTRDEFSVWINNRYDKRNPDFTLVLDSPYYDVYDNTNTFVCRFKSFNLKRYSYSECRQYFVDKVTKICGSGTINTK